MKVKISIIESKNDSDKADHNEDKEMETYFNN